MLINGDLTKVVLLDAGQMDWIASPAAAQGCVIFVRLWQFRLGDHAQIVCKTGEDERLEPRPEAKSSRLLFHDDAEQVTLETWSPDANLTIANERGLEFMIRGGPAKPDRGISEVLL